MRAGRPRLGIRSLLLLLLLPVVVVLLVLDSLSDYRTLANAIDSAYDAALLESAHLLGGGLALGDDGQLRVESSVHAQVLVREQARRHRHFRIEAVDPGAGAPQGRTLAGTDDLPQPPVLPASPDEEVFYNTTYQDQPLRAVAVLRIVRNNQLSRQALVIMAESEDWRSGRELRARGQEAATDISMLLLETIFIYFGVHWALRSLRRLSKEVAVRRPEDLTPLDERDVPGEVVPLVHAVNLHLERHRQMLDERAQFLADASHQLRTPLAIISTQAQYALREPDPARAREALQAIVEQLGRSRRLTEQLLSMAHASQAEATQTEVVDLASIARDAVMQYLPLAREKDQDLGWVDTRADGVSDAAVSAGEVELREILANLIHNAIRYSPEGANITVSITVAQYRYEIAVTDDGPGIPMDQHERVFERFERAGGPGAMGGSGLGLSIARAYARRNRGEVELRDGEPNGSGGRGLSAVLWLPRILEI